MPISGIDAATGTIASAPPRNTRGVDGLKSEDFFKLLITELQQQDPLKPTETKDMIGQVSQIRTIEQSERLNSALEKMAEAQRTIGAGDFLGKYVVARTMDAEGQVREQAGVVTGVRFAPDGTALLDLDSGQSIRALDVVNVTTPEHAESVSGAAAG